MKVYVDKLPKSCDRCPCNDQDYNCRLTGEVFEFYTHEKRGKLCRLEELSEVIKKDRRWIPISEKEPELNEPVWVSDGKIVWKDCLIDLAKLMGCIDSDAFPWAICWIYGGNVKAWMPYHLPQPGAYTEE